MSEVVSAVTHTVIDASQEAGVLSLPSPAFERPSLLIASGAVAVGGILMELRARHTESRMSAGVPVADPELAKQENINGKRTRRLERRAYGAAVAAVSLALAQAAGPYETETEAKGNASVVINAGYSAEVPDMNGAEQSTTRVDASVDGSLASAESNDVPFSFVLAADGSRSIEPAFAGHEDLSEVRNAIEQTTNKRESFRNGNSLIDGIRDAKAFSTRDEANKIIIIASKISDKEKGEILKLRKQMKKESPENSLDAIVVGRGEGGFVVGKESLKSAPSPEDFEDALGAKNVYEARSAGEVEDAVDRILDEVNVIESKQNLYGFGYGAIVSAALGLGIAAFRRLSGRIMGK